MAIMQRGMGYFPAWHLFSLEASVIRREAGEIPSEEPNFYLINAISHSSQHLKMGSPYSSQHIPQHIFHTIA